MTKKLGNKQAASRILCHDNYCANKFIDQLKIEKKHDR